MEKVDQESGRQHLVFWPCCYVFFFRVLMSFIGHECGIAFFPGIVRTVAGTMRWVREKAERSAVIIKIYCKKQWNSLEKRAPGVSHGCPNGQLKTRPPSYSIGSALDCASSDFDDSDALFFIFIFIFFHCPLLARRILTNVLGIFFPSETSFFCNVCSTWSEGSRLFATRFIYFLFFPVTGALRSS